MLDSLFLLIYLNQITVNVTVPVGDPAFLVHVNAPPSVLNANVQVAWFPAETRQFIKVVLINE
ncbi:MAG: hypothetical protein PHQ86_09795, partial [Dehalococcoidales bacterium]|nr:hypothetical protein [Dehalococcoidales bacterium]